MTTPIVSPYTFADLQTPKDVLTNKRALYDALIANGHTAALSWEDGDTPAALVEIEADALTNFQFATQANLYSGFNDFATGDALTEHSREIYQNDKRLGQNLIGRIQLTDTGAGPFTFDPKSISVSVGQGGLLYDGIDDPTGTVTGNLTLPLFGSVFVYVRATGTGTIFNAAIGTVNTFARGILNGATVTNPSDWLSAPGTQAGANDEAEDSLRQRNRTQWGTLGTGSPQFAYEKWVRDSDVSITRVKIFTNLDILDPGTVTAIVAGSAGAVAPSVVLNVQNAVAPAQVGGSKIPETARFVAASAANRVIPVVGTLYVQGEYNTGAFQSQVSENVATFQAALDIGAKVSWQRLWEAITEIAGLNPNIITDVDVVAPNADIQLQYFEVAVFDLTALAFVSV